MAPAGEMAQLVTMMSGQNSLCRDTQQDYTKEEKSTISYLALLVFFFLQLKKGEENRQRKAKPKLRKEIKS